MGGGAAADPWVRVGHGCGHADGRVGAVAAGEGGEGGGGGGGVPLQDRVPGPCGLGPARLDALPRVDEVGGEGRLPGEVGGVAVQAAGVAFGR